MAGFNLVNNYISIYKNHPIFITDRKVFDYLEDNYKLFNRVTSFQIPVPINLYDYPLHYYTIVNFHRHEIDIVVVAIISDRPVMRYIVCTIISFDIVNCDAEKDIKNMIGEAADYE